ncbi:hypothetical protein FHP29_10345 [Nocardioides albidus]|uniref:LppX_LprAFG lipoprotein n=1 Tax=Nocardioides albidus TaxID=1517589 RepID=A0A5C4VWY7_9ACTN|nr:hypothetical protein [Nocardioides albidus]TNM40444.1 hypothetical protein FHP29_10345 [Nocardioides albidus]
MIRRVVLVLLAALVGLGLVACSDEKESAKESGEKQSGAGSSSYEPYDRESLIAAMGKAIEANPTVRFRVDAGNEQMDFRVRFGKGDEVAMAGTIEGDEPFEMVAVDGHYYGREPGDAKYVELPQELLGPLLEEIGDMSPRAMVEDMRRDTKSVEYAGSETVDGEVLHRYDVEVSPAAVQEELGADAKGLRVRYRMWLAEDDLMRKVVVKAMGAEVVAHMSDWGADLDIQAPDPADVEQP